MKRARTALGLRKRKFMFQYPTGSTCASLIITDVTSFRIVVASSKEDRRKLIPMYNRDACYRQLLVEDTTHLAGQRTKCSFVSVCEHDNDQILGSLLTTISAQHLGLVCLLAKSL